MTLIRCFLVSSVLMFSCGVIAQTGSIRGKVISGEEPLEFANVGIRGTSLGASTDLHGIFEIKEVPLDQVVVVVTSIGYERQERIVELSSEHPTAMIQLDLREKIGELDEVVVSGTMKEVSKLQSPVPVEVYTDDFFKANPTPSVFECLQNVNGVRPQVNCNICNTGDIHINGLEGPYTMVLIDGMPIVSGLSTVYGLTGIPQSLIERMEVVKGPASTLYGSEAVGGLINIITKKPAAAPLFSVDVFGTSWAELNIDLGARYQLVRNVQGLAGVNYFNYQNPIDNNGDGFTDVTLQHRISVFNKFNFLRKENRVFTLAGRYVYEDRWGGDMNWEKKYRGGTEVYGESIYTSRWELFSAYQLPLQERIDVQLSANGHHQNSVYGNTRYMADQYIFFSQLVWYKTLGAHDLVSGIAYRMTNYDDNTPATSSVDSLTNEPSITHLPGLFLQDEIALSDRHKLLAGVRYDYNSFHGSILSPRINYKWNSPDQFSVVRLSLGNGYRVANVFTEDHAALTGAREVVFTEDLKPETSWNVNLNVVKKIFTRKGFLIGVDGSAFYTYFTNRILPDYETNPNQIIYSNLDGYSVSKGASLNLDLSWSGGLKIFAGGTLMDVSVMENAEKTRQLLTERFSGVWSIGRSFSALDLTVDYTGNLYGPMRLPLLSDLDERSAYSDWYSVQNIQCTKGVSEQWEIYGGIKNLLNFTPPANSIARTFDPFDEQVTFDAEGKVLPTADNPQALTFDPSYVYASNQGIRVFLGARYTLK